MRKSQTNLQRFLRTLDHTDRICRPQLSKVDGIDEPASLRICHICAPFFTELFHTCEFADNVHLSVLLGESLVGHVSRGALSAHPDVTTRLLRTRGRGALHAAEGNVPGRLVNYIK